MRKTLHEYLKSQYEGFYDGSGLFDIDSAFTECYKYAELTNRKPKLGDFIGENAIFKGEWEATYEQYYSFIIDMSLRIRITFYDCECYVNIWDIGGDYLGDLNINRIEDLPPQIEFKDNVQ